MNLAVLTGRQVSRPLKVFLVSRSGDVADVTLHSSCSSKDQSVLKVRIQLNNAIFTHHLNQFFAVI